MSNQDAANAAALQRYYKLHASIYDLTRWSFLFGRHAVIKMAARHIKPNNILEIGCGTGKNLESLAKQFPQARITGLDLSKDMLDIASKKSERFNGRVNVVEQKYDSPIKNSQGEVEQYDLILFSYALSMFNPGWDIAINAAKQQLSDNGKIAIVDFHHSRFKAYRDWMGVNHVKMEAHLSPKLENEFTSVQKEIRKAYFGVWEYVLFIGTN